MNKDMGDMKAVNATTAETSSRKGPKKECNDVIFAILFLAAFIMTIALTVMYGDDVMNSSWEEIKEKSYSKYKYVFHITAVIAGCASVGTLLWTVFMLCCGSMLIWSCTFIIIVGNITAGVIGSKALYEQEVELFWWPAVLCGTIALLLAAYVCCIRKRIRFASTNLQVACKAILSFPCTLVVAFSFVVVQGLWAVVWALATYACLHHDDYSDNPDSKGYSKGQQFGIMLGMVCVFFWGSFVLKNIVHVTTAGTIATWWFQGDSPMAATSALFRALTYSFGSICFGSLVVSIIETIRAVFSFLRNSVAGSGNCALSALFCCMECLVGCISKMAQYFNKYAFTYVAIYGHSFIHAGKHVFELFSGKGWSAVANDSLIENVLMVGGMLVGIICAVSGWMLVEYADSKYFEGIQHPKQVLGVSGFLIGYTIAATIFSVISGGVATIFVLFAEDPEALKKSHEEEFDALHTTWSEIYPEEYKGEEKKKELEMQSV